MALLSKIFSRIRGGELGESDWDELQNALIESDLGSELSSELIELAKKVRADSFVEALDRALHACLTTEPRTLVKALSRPTTVLVVGVNGAGKTTSVAKLMNFLADRDQKTVVAAADTFRAAAIEQMQTWGERLDIPVIAGKFQGDPASVVFDALAAAKERSADYLLIDTAGRLHTKTNLMDELAKIRRVLEKASPVDEVLLVVDATTGQNGIIQARQFAQGVGVTGLILTKLDGSAKGGIAVAIERELGLPIKFIGTGEAATDLAPFDPDSYISALIGSE